MRFLRIGTSGVGRKSRLGYGRRKKQVWRRPRGRHNKRRERQKGRANIVEIGYRTEKATRDLINNKIPMRIENLKQAHAATKENIVIIARVGRKKRMEIEKILHGKNIEIANKKGAQDEKI